VDETRLLVWVTDVDDADGREMGMKNERQDALVEGHAVALLLFLDKGLTRLDGIVVDGTVVPVGSVGAIVLVGGRCIEARRHTPSEEALEISEVRVGDGPFEGLEDVGYVAVGTDVWATEPTNESGSVAVELEEESCSCLEGTVGINIVLSLPVGLEAGQLVKVNVQEVGPKL
jgi:hypothetical protein